MFPQFKRLNNESGIVLFIVLMTAIIIMIFSVGIVTQSMNEINYAQQQIDQISSEQLAKGLFWNAYSSGMTLYNDTENATNRTYSGILTALNSTNGIANYQIQVTYDTFN